MTEPLTGAALATAGAVAFNTLFKRGFIEESFVEHANNVTFSEASYSIFFVTVFCVKFLV